MLITPMDVLTQFPVRKSRQQKHAFRNAVAEYVRPLGYEAKEEACRCGGRNLVMGDPEKADILITAHYDTCARLPFPNFSTPCSFFWFMGFQLLLTLGFFLIFLAVTNGAILLLGDHRLSAFLGVLCLEAVVLLMLIGPANPSNANDNTSGVVTVLEILRTLDPGLRDRVCFVLFDLEEAGLIGSAAYRKAHKKATNRQLVLNIDCVGEGDELLMFPTKRLKKDAGAMAPLYGVCGYWGKKSLLVRDKGFSFYPSDQMSFPRGIGIAALKRNKKLLYLDRIHTVRDTCLDQTNINILRSALTSYVTKSAM